MDKNQSTTGQSGNFQQTLTPSQAEPLVKAGYEAAHGQPGWDRLDQSRKEEIVQGAITNFGGSNR